MNRIAIEIDERDYDTLTKAAVMRGLTLQEIAEEIITIVIQDCLINAILDDGAEKLQPTSEITFKDMLAALEREGSERAAAKFLGMPQSTFHSRMKTARSRP